jgi:hypothetical protein
LSLGRILQLAATVVAFAAATVICLVAACYALFALLAPHLGAAGASAVVCGVSGLLVLLLALALKHRAARRPRRGKEDDGPLAQALVLARRRPLIATAVGVAGAVLLLRNPTLISALVSAALAGRASKPKR